MDAPKCKKCKEQTYKLLNVRRYICNKCKVDYAYTDFETKDFEWKK